MSEKTVTLPVLGPGRKIADDMPHNRGADTLKFLLIPFVCFWSFGFPDGRGIVATFSGFAIPAFFILSGYFVLGPDKDVCRKKMKRAIRRALIIFAVMFVCYFAINIALMTADGVNWREELLSKRILFNFLVLNVWPFAVGSNIWFIQSLLYVYIFLLLADSWGWLRHYKLLMGLSMLFMVAAGELAAVLNFHILDYAYIPGGAVTRALPYVLLGMLLREKTKRLKAVRGWVYLLIFVLGAGLAFGEIYGLSLMGKLAYEGHMVGYGVMAAAGAPGGFPARDEAHGLLRSWAKLRQTDVCPGQSPVFWYPDRDEHDGSPVYGNRVAVRRYRRVCALHADQRFDHRRQKDAVTAWGILVKLGFVCLGVWLTMVIWGKTGRNAGGTPAVTETSAKSGKMLGKKLIKF
jgi:surface polysaccharide O-acyltransferase-like enzyme